MAKKEKNLSLYKKVRRFFWRRIVREVVLKYENPGRYIIEKKFFPRIKDKKVLLVGCEHYTEHYPRKLRKNMLWSIDINPDVAKYGAKEHVVGDISYATRYYPKKNFDFVFLGGIFGYGVNDKKTAERTMKECYEILKKNGKLIIWWSDMPKHNQVIPQELKNYRLFKESSFAGIKSGHRTKQRSQFEILVKK